jgi:hypothetical protein
LTPGPGVTAAFCWSALDELAGWAAGRGGELGDSVKDDSARWSVASHNRIAHRQHYKEISETA